LEGAVVVHGEAGLSTTHEMYLKVLYRLQQENDIGRVRDMAKGLGVTPSTVSTVLKKLELGGLVAHDRYGIVKLTPAGTRVAQCIVRRFEIIRAFLVDVLGLDVEPASIDACTMEHAVSPATVNRLDLFVQRVARGEVVLPTLPAAESSIAICADCEVSGICQAVRSLEPSALSPGRN
jgi:DtxR family Mn-dependent transcriptional regulator